MSEQKANSRHHDVALEALVEIQKRAAAMTDPQLKQMLLATSCRIIDYVLEDDTNQSAA